MLDVKKIREDFPILKREVNGQPLVYFDNAASSQKPEQVIKGIADYYHQKHSNVHRGVHQLSQEATQAFEEAREKVKNFINAPSVEECIFVSGTTEGINLVAQTYGRQNIHKGDEIILSYLEHHSNIVPWQMLAQEKEAIIKVIPVNQKGELDIEAYKNLLSNKTKIVCVNHVSNALGTINPIEEIIKLAHEHNAVVLIDGAQSTPHIKIDVQALDVDFFVFSGHKMCAPTGTGALYGKRKYLDQMPPWKGGGEMIKEVSFSGTTYGETPHKFEAGTPDIEGGIALGLAIDYLNSIGLENIHNYEDDLLRYATEKISEIPQVKLIGTADQKASVLSFIVDGIHPFDIGTLLDQMGVAVRTGHHCAQPLMDYFDIPGTIRASFAFYNTKEEIDVFISSLKKAIGMLL